MILKLLDGLLTEGSIKFAVELPLFVIVIACAVGATVYPAACEVNGVIAVADIFS